MQFPMPSWTTIISSSSADISALQTFVNPITFWILAAVIVIGVATLAVGLLMRLVHHK